ncbi:VWA domain-containing protein, partial [Candidatus Sumerlaeota bacterium]|nr:VWA domain-containing protein [Candidatus Sumerlaeota bacterium]
MHVQFTQPYLLLLIVPLALHVIWMGRRLRMLGPARRITAIIIRLMLVSLLVCALAGIRMAKDSKNLTVFFLMDGSDSLPEAQKNYANGYVKKNLLDIGANDEAGIIVFGSNAAVERGPSKDSEFDRPQSVVNTKGTNIADALQLAMACFVGESQKRIVLLSDGNQNSGDAEAIAQSVKASHIALDVVPLKYENRNDVILEKVLVENRVSLDQPFDLKIIASSRQSGPAKLSVHQDGKLIGTYDIKLDADKKNSFVIPTQVRDSGFHTYEAQIHADGDAIPENNRGFAFTYGEGEPRVLLVDGDGSPSKVLPSMLESEKIKVEVADPAGLPSSLRDLENYDGLIFNNVAASDITDTQMKIIETAVHDLGLGFIMIGGEKSSGPGGYNDSPIERILPVDMEMKNEKILPQGALVPIIHTVEIPQGQFWAEKIAQASLDVLSPHDLMGVLYYSWNGGEAWLYPLQEVGNKVKMTNLIKSIQPGDMPSFDTTLQMAYDALVGCSASVKHIVVISDGDPATPAQALATKIKNAKITISTVCIAPHS